MKQYRHLCAICGETGPQIHHIDEDSSNNDPLNLLPLCPNCHLRDQHDPTAPIDPRKVRLFRIHKDPMILSSQFEPLFRRLSWLLNVGDNFDGDRCQSLSEDLIAFVSNFEMGEYYADKLKRLLQRPVTAIHSIDDERHIADQQKLDMEYLQDLSANSEQAIELLVELLRYQSTWEPE